MIGPFLHKDIVHGHAPGSQVVGQGRAVGVSDEWFPGISCKPSRIVDVPFDALAICVHVGLLSGGTKMYQESLQRKD